MKADSETGLKTLSAILSTVLSTSNSSRKSDILQIAKIVNKAHAPNVIRADTMANTACNIVKSVNQSHKQHA